MTSTGPSRLPDGARALADAVPWRAVLVDLVVVAAWVVAASAAFRAAGLPVLAYYLVVFGGVLGYSLAGRPLSDRVFE